MVERALCIRRLAVLAGLTFVTFVGGCKVADGLRQRVFAVQFEAAACDFLSSCGIYPDTAECKLANPVPLQMELLEECPCYDANAAKDCIDALTRNEGSCTSAGTTARAVEYPDACTRVCCQEDCTEAECQFFRLSAEEKCEEVFDTDSAEAEVMRARLQPNGDAECYPIDTTRRTCHFDPGMVKLPPEPELAARLLYYGRGPLPGAINTILPCGETAEELVLCPSAATGSGDHYVLLYETAEPLTQAHPDNLYELGFVFDGDESAENNFRPTTLFSTDFFENTDQWFEARYSPTTGWSSRALLARGMEVVSVPDSAARIVIRGRVAALVVPASEVDAFDPGARVTLFRHTGDLGQEQPFDWSGSVTPPQGAPLLRRLLRRPW